MAYLAATSKNIRFKLFADDAKDYKQLGINATE